MKKYFRAGSVIGAVTCAMVSGSAFAADMPVSRESTVIPVPTYTWSGFYVGFHGGWGFGDVNFIKSAADLNNHTMDGGLAGGHIGYNWQMGYSWLIGIEGSGTWSGVKKTFIGAFDPPFPNDRWTTEVKWLATVTPRVGVTISNWMWYLKGGVAFADIDHRLESVIDAVFFETSSTRVGWTAGFGGELMLGNWIFGVEGNFYDFGSFSANSGIENFPDHNVEVTMWSILGRLSYKFNSPSSPVVTRY